MKKLYLINLTIVFIFLLTTAHAQTNTQSYKQLIVVLRNGERIEGREGIYNGARLTGKTLSGTTLDISSGDIKTLYVSEGTQTGTMAILGAGVGLAIGLGAILQASSKENVTIDEERAIGITVGLTAAGGLIGGLIGSSSTSWKIIPIETSLLLDPVNNNVHFSLSLRH